MAKEVDMTIDYERLRRAMITRETMKGFITRVPAPTVRVSHINNADPDQLLRMARSCGINPQRYKIKEKKNKK